MLHQIKSLINDVQLQQQLKQAADLADAVKLIVNAGAAKGYTFSKETVSRTLASMMPAEPSQLSEEDLLSVAGAGGRTFPENAQLSHTDCCHLN